MGLMQKPSPTSNAVDARRWVLSVAVPLVDRIAAGRCRSRGRFDDAAVDALAAEYQSRLTPSLTDRLAREHAPTRDVEALTRDLRAYFRTLDGAADQLTGRDGALDRLDAYGPDRDDMDPAADGGRDAYDVLLGALSEDRLTVEAEAEAAYRSDARRSAWRREAKARRHLERLQASTPSSGGSRALRKAAGASLGEIGEQDGVTANAVTNSVKRFLANLPAADREALAALRLVDENPAKARRHRS